MVAFAGLMMGLVGGVVWGAYQVLAWSVRGAVWVFLEVVERADLSAVAVNPT